MKSEQDPPNPFSVVLTAAAACALFFLAGKGLIGILEFLSPLNPGSAARAWIVAAITMALDVADGLIIVAAMYRLRVGREIFSWRGGLPAAGLGIVVGALARYAFKPGAFLESAALAALGVNPYRAMSTVLVGPILESILFCGVFYTTLRRRLPAPAAFALASAIFALSEFALRYPGSPGQFAFLGAKLTLAVVFTAPYALTGSLLAPIAAHILYNL